MRPKYLHTARLLLQRNQNPWQFITVLDTSDCNDLIWCRFGWQCLSSVRRAIQRQVEKPQWLQHLCYIFRVTRVHELLHAANVVPPTPRNRWQLRRLPQTWWATATEEEQEQEIGGMREILRKWGNVQVEDIMGYRAPYIQVGGNTEFRALRNLGFLYESSMPTQVFRDPPLWPYTLDYQSIQDCVIEPCPTGK